MPGCDDDGGKKKSSAGSSFTAQGGDSSILGGGTGGHISLTSTGGIKITPGGSVNASFSFPSVDPDMGENPLVISADTSLALDPAVEPAAGTPYLVADDQNVYISDGDSVMTEAEEIATGLEIRAGADVLLPLNMGPGTSCSLTFHDSVVISGAVSTDYASAINRGPLTIQALYGYFLLGGRGAINLTGATSVPPINGGGGGTMQIIAGADVLIQGDINCSGGSGAAGGSGGSMSIQSQYKSIYISSTIEADGGEGTTGAGGSAPPVNVIAPYGCIYSSVDFSLNGGASEEADGGGGGSLTMQAGPGATGEQKFSGRVSANGGTSLLASGGNGGSITMLSFGGILHVSADISARGGVAETDGTAGVDSGGNGGNVTFMTQTSTSNATGRTMPCGPLRVAGSFNLDGGSGAEGGGNGGSMQCNNTSYAEYIDPPAQPVELVGFGLFSLNGGSGATAGGAGGSTSLTCIPATYIGEIYETGSLLNEAAFDLSGGDGDSSVGGDGGSLSMVTVPCSNPAATIVNNGAIDITGGDGHAGGSGGTCTIQGAGDVVIYGSIDTGGGEADGPATNGGDGGTISIGALSTYATRGITIGTSIAASGGSGDIGGNGAAVTLTTYGDFRCAGRIESRGGNARESAADGGTGGTVTVNGPPSDYFSVFNNSAAIDVSGGSGFSGGDSGGVNVQFYGEITNTGNIDARGGDSSGDTGSGGIGANGSITISAMGYYDLINSGTITCDGGEASGVNATGGGSLLVQFMATSQIINSGNILARGGESTANASAQGGTVQLTSGGVLFTTNNARLISVQGGDGAAVLNHGHITIDMLEIFVEDGTLP